MPPRETLTVSIRHLRWAKISLGAVQARHLKMIKGVRMRTLSGSGTSRQIATLTRIAMCTVMTTLRAQKVQPRSPKSLYPQAGNCLRYLGLTPTAQTRSPSRSPSNRARTATRVSHRAAKTSLPERPRQASIKMETTVKICCKR